MCRRVVSRSLAGGAAWREVCAKQVLGRPTGPDEMSAGVAAKYSTFTTMRGDGAILGPWSAWLHDPDLGRALWESTKGMTRFRHLPEMIRQIVILAVGSKFGAAYEIYAHGAVALSNGM